VATLVQRFGCTEDQVVEALLHDVPEEEGGAGVV
jgi:predicted HD phosphohydrolase